jgi:hypothetical protein
VKICGLREGYGASSVSIYHAPFSPAYGVSFSRFCSSSTKNSFFPLLPKQAQKSCFFCSVFLTVGNGDDDAMTKV